MSESELHIHVGTDVDLDEAQALAVRVNGLCERLSMALFEAGYPVEEIRLRFIADGGATTQNGVLELVMSDPDQELPNEVLDHALALAGGDLSLRDGDDEIPL